MDHRVTRRAEARRDVIELADYVSHESFDAAVRFLDAADETFKFLAANREIGQLCHFADERTVGIRVWPMHGFRNYLVFYRTTDDGVIIVRVLHGARDIETLFGVEK